MRALTSIILFLCVLAVGALLGYEISQRDQDKSTSASSKQATVPDLIPPSLSVPGGATTLPGLPATPGVEGSAPAGLDLTQLANLAAGAYKAESAAEFKSQAADASSEFQYLQGVTYLRNAMFEIRAAAAIKSAKKQAREIERREHLERAGLYLGAVAVIAEARRQAADAKLRARLKVLGTRTSAYLDQVYSAATATGNSANREVNALARSVGRSEIKLTELISRTAAADSASLAALLREIDAAIAALSVAQSVE